MEGFPLLHPFRLFSAALLGVLVLLGPCGAFADTGIALDAGYLYGAPSGTTATVLPTGSLLLLVGSASGTSFASPTIGSYTGNTDTIIAAGAFNTNFASGGGANSMGGETSNTFTLSTTSYPTSLVGHDVALYWYPTISFTQYNNGAGTKPSAFTPYGAYNPLAITVTANTTLNPDGGNTWVVPADGNNNYRLTFLTLSDGGHQNETEGYARFTVVPEPSATMFLSGIALTFAALYFRPCRRLAALTA